MNELHCYRDKPLRSWLKTAQAAGDLRPLTYSQGRGAGHREEGHQPGTETTENKKLSQEGCPYKCLPEILTNMMSHRKKAEKTVRCVTKFSSTKQGDVASNASGHGVLCGGLCLRNLCVSTTLSASAKVEKRN